jgi:hypothetical protein
MAKEFVKPPNISLKAITKGSTEELEWQEFLGTNPIIIKGKLIVSMEVKGII